MRFYPRREGYLGREHHGEYEVRTYATLRVACAGEDPLTPCPLLTQRAGCCRPSRTLSGVPPHGGGVARRNAEPSTGTAHKAAPRVLCRKEGRVPCV